MVGVLNGLNGLNVLNQAYPLIVRHIFSLVE
jgi:hypothetical protein